MAILDQINTRVDPALKAEYDAIAAALDVPAATLFRELLEKGLPDLRDRAKDAAKKRGGWPGNVPSVLVESELMTLMRSISRSEPLSIQPRDLLGPRSKALLSLLRWVWEAEPDDKTHAKLTSWLAGLNIKAALQAAPKEGSLLPQHSPPSRPVKSYPRRGSE